MTRDMDPFRSVKQVGNKAQFIEAAWPAYQSAMELVHTQVLQAQGVAHSSEAGPTSGGDTTDPVLAAVEELLEIDAEYGKVVEAISMAHRAMELAQSLMAPRSRRSAAPGAVDEAKKANECLCRYSQEPWADPTCEQQRHINPDGVTLQDGLSDACLRRRSRWRAEGDGYQPRPARRRINPKAPEVHQLQTVEEGAVVSGACSCGWSIVHALSASVVVAAHALHAGNTSEQLAG